MIEEAGFEVLEAANADEAILLLEARRDITVVFTDIEMPGSMDGLKLRERGKPFLQSPSPRRPGKQLSTKSSG
jgi:CheY-like chemotaxis protein